MISSPEGEEGWLSQLRMLWSERYFLWSYRDVGGGLNLTFSNLNVFQRSLLEKSSQGDDKLSVNKSKCLWINFRCFIVGLRTLSVFFILLLSGVFKRRRLMRGSCDLFDGSPRHISEVGRLYLLIPRRYCLSILCKLVFDLICFSVRVANTRDLCEKFGWRFYFRSIIRDFKLDFFVVRFFFHLGTFLKTERIYISPEISEREFSFVEGVVTSGTHAKLIVSYQIDSFESDFRVEKLRGLTSVSIAADVFRLVKFPRLDRSSFYSFVGDRHLRILLSGNDWECVLAERFLKKYCAYSLACTRPTVHLHPGIVYMESEIMRLDNCAVESGFDFEQNNKDDVVLFFSGSVGFRLYEKNYKRIGWIDIGNWHRSMRSLYIGMVCVGYGEF